MNFSSALCFRQCYDEKTKSWRVIAVISPNF